jgi:Family of unknown function (DUF6191)
VQQNGNRIVRSGARTAMADAIARPGPYPETMTQWGIDTLFNPGKRHMDEEKRRLQSTREEVGDSSGGRRIDLEGGKVTLTGRPGSDEAGDDTQDVAEAPATAQDEAGEPDAEETPAGRARRRRRKAG